jgi:hypothetical protein
MAADDQIERKRARKRVWVYELRMPEKQKRINRKTIVRGARVVKAMVTSGHSLESTPNLGIQLRVQEVVGGIGEAERCSQ